MSRSAVGTGVNECGEKMTACRLAGGDRDGLLADALRQPEHVAASRSEKHIDRQGRPDEGAAASSASRPA